MVTAEISSKKWTYQNYYDLGDGKRYEVIGGELFMAPAPYYKHQHVSANLFLFMGQYVKEKGFGELLHAPTDVILDDENVVQPDILFIANINSGVIQEKGIFGSPDLVIGIISPTSIQRDRHEKKELYERFKVREYWLVDPANKSIEVFTLENDKYKLFSFASEKGMVKSNVIAKLEVDLSEIMSETA